MTRRRKDVPLLESINPDQIYGTQLAPAIFNLGWQAARDKIRAGKLPRPLPLHEGSKREGWLGSEIIAHRERMRALAEERAAIDAARPKQKQPEAFKKGKTKKKTQKVKLKPARSA